MLGNNISLTEGRSHAGSWGTLLRGKDGSPPVVSVVSICLFVWNQDNSGPDETRFRASGLQQFPVKQKPFKVNKQISANGKKKIHALKLH